MGPQRSLGTLALAVAAAAAAACADTTTQAHLGWGPGQLGAEQRCQRGAIAACGELGRFLVASETVAKDRDRGLVLLEIACGNDDAASCAALGKMYVDPDRDHDKARARARELLARACARGAAEGCTWSGAVLEIDHADRAEVIAAFDKGCALGDALGCERLGNARWRDTFGDGRANAEVAYGRACGLGRLSSCHLLAMVLERDPARWAQGLELLRQNCARGYVRSCAVAAWSFAPVVAGHVNCGRAEPLARQACDGKEADACAIIDACALDGPARGAALESLRHACEEGAAAGCLYWADAQRADTDAERVEKAYEIACRGAAPVADVACPRLAVITLRRAQLSVDAERPLAQLREACEHGSGEACCALADEHERGKWLAADATKAGELRAKACNLGDQHCCRPGSSAPPP